MRPDERGLGGALQIQAEHAHFMRSLLHGQQCHSGMQVPLQRCSYDADTLSLNRSAAGAISHCELCSRPAVRCSAENQTL